MPRTPERVRGPIWVAPRPKLGSFSDSLRPPGRTIVGLTTKTLREEMTMNGLYKSLLARPTQARQIRLITLGEAPSAAPMATLALADVRLGSSRGLTCAPP